MSWTAIDGRILTLADAIAAINATQWGPNTWKPSGGVLHNTAVPSLGRAEQFSIEHWRDMWVDFYKAKWSAGPHFFAFPDHADPNHPCIAFFTPITHRGVHSPSWNGTKFGLEMVADFDTEDAGAGLGHQVYNNAVAIFGTLCARLGIDPDGIKMHYEDPNTTHACPGKHIHKADFIQAVHEYMGEGGEHAGGTVPPNVVETHGRVVVAANDLLNVRSLAGVSGIIVAQLKTGADVVMKDRAQNGKTPWLHIAIPSIGKDGWVNANYVKPA